MRQRGGNGSQLFGEPPETGGTRVIAHLGVIGCEQPVDRTRQCTLYRADTYAATPLRRPS